MIILRQKEFGFFDGIRKLNDRYCKWKNPNYKTEDELLAERSAKYSQERQAKQKNLEDKFASISRQHKILLDIDKKTEKFFPSWGDGDEYPQLYLFLSDDYKYHDYGNIALGIQGQEEYQWNGNNWTELNSGKKIYNLKSELLKNLGNYRKEWKKIDYLDEEEINEVVRYLDALINEIDRSNL